MYIWASTHPTPGENTSMKNISYEKIPETLSKRHILVAVKKIFLASRVAGEKFENAMRIRKEK